MLLRLDFLGFRSTCNVTSQHILHLVKRCAWFALARADDVRLIALRSAGAKNFCKCAAPTLTPTASFGIFILCTKNSHALAVSAKLAVSDRSSEQLGEVASVLFVLISGGGGPRHRGRHLWGALWDRGPGWVPPAQEMSSPLHSWLMGHGSSH